MGIISLTLENIASEHICCAIADKKCSAGYKAKKVWLKSQIEQGYVFKKLDVRGKVFIQYGPAEFAWAPVSAPGYMMIDCFWVSGQYKQKGYGKALYEECLNDSADKNGIVAVTGNKKMPFLSDTKFFEKQGFELCDTAAPYFELWYKSFNKHSLTPKFNACAKDAICDVPSGLAVYYSDTCPFTDFYVNTELAEAAKAKNIPMFIKKIETMEQAQQHFVPFTIYSLFYNGKFVTHQILSKNSFQKFSSEHFFL
jgi:N-acetylglutamate synthase-like GNAT family acetyltransferase